MSLPSVIRSFRAAAVPLLLSSVASCGSSSAAPMGGTSTFVGSVEGTNLLVGLVVTNDEALLFFCGAGKTLATETHWMHGAVTVGQSFNLTDGTATAAGAAAGGSGATHLTGTLMESASAKPLTWSADLVSGGTLAGVYTHQLSEGLVALIVEQPTAKAMPTAQGAFHELKVKEAILQVTPLSPLTVSDKGLAVEVVVSGVKQEVFLSAAVGD